MSTSTQSSPAEHRCAHEQADLSALLDGELEAALVPETVDRVLHCPSCSRFYAEARRLQGLLTIAGKIEGPEPPPELWSRIADRAGRADAPASNVVRPAAWLGSRARGLLAAAAVLAACTWLLVSSPLFDQPDTLSTEVQALSESSEPMTDDRFVAIAAELLQADERYLEEMRSLMRQLDNERYAERSTSESRRTSEGSFPSSDGYDPIESDGSGADVNVQLW